VDPNAESKKRVKLTLSPLIYKTFKLLCKQKGYGHPSRLVEAFMLACIKNPVLPIVIFELNKRKGEK